MSGRFQLGLYKWTYKNGSFNVCFRPYGIFYCATYPTSGDWKMTSTSLLVNWKEYGIYEFPLSKEETMTTMEGFAQDNAANWRRIEFLRDFSHGEKLLLGAGYGTVWNFQYEKGSFEVEFHCDGYNHFNCPQYPAHSHWGMDEETGLINVNWGQYGEYELKVSDEMNSTLSGSKKGQPNNWRRCTLIRSLEPDSSKAHDHSHNHVHNEDCKH